jgi:peroxiredoxin
MKAVEWQLARRARERTAAAATVLLAALLLLGAAAGAADAKGAPAGEAAAAGDDRTGDQKARDERLPAFEGRTLDGKPLSTTAFAGKRLLLLCFNPGVAQAEAYAHALAAVASEQVANNFAIAGVAMGLDSKKARDFARKHDLDFPIFDDSDGSIAARLTLQSPLMLVGSDAEGRVSLAWFGFEHDDGMPAASIEGRIRDWLRLPSRSVEDGKLVDYPKAPVFEAERLDGNGRFRLADVAGKPVVLMFFLSTCSHCQDALRFFKAELARFPDAARPPFVGISVDARASSARLELQTRGLEFFPALSDENHKIAEAYGSFAKVPDILLLDASGRIVHRRMGWDDGHDPDVMRMRLASLAGLRVPMLLSRIGYSGNDACAVCHVAEAATWRFTKHADAFATLVMRGADRDAKCVGCHVVGFGDKGGWTEAARQSHLENVGCESCHGRGGGHLEAAVGGKAALPAASGYEAACLRCHDPKHSLGFDYPTFLPRISHTAIAALGDARRSELLRGRDKPRDLLPMSAGIVGSAACKSCHAREYEIWSRSPHARAVESLRAKDKEDEADCLRCHVTGFGRPGGFAKGDRATPENDLARVGCESCHGAGAEHVRSGGKQAAGIVGLSDKCESCVILKICGSCHDDANDPEFRFHVAQKIDRQRHGGAATAMQAH